MNSQIDLTKSTFTNYFPHFVALNRSLEAPYIRLVIFKFLIICVLLPYLANDVLLARSQVDRDKFGLGLTQKHLPFKQRVLRRLQPSVRHGVARLERLLKPGSFYTFSELDRPLIRSELGISHVLIRLAVVNTLRNSLDHLETLTALFLRLLHHFERANLLSSYDTFGQKTTLFQDLLIVIFL